MKALFGALAAAALLGAPLAASAQAHDGYGDDGRGGYAPAPQHRDASANNGYRGAIPPPRGYAGDRGGYVDRGQVDRGGYVDRGADNGYRRDSGYAGRGYADRGYARGGYDNRGYANRADGRGYDDRGYRGGYGYGGYGGYGGSIGLAFGGAPYAYSYPDDNGYYQPFDYAYSDQDGAYYAGDAGPPSEGYSEDAGPPAQYDGDDNAPPPAPYYGAPQGDESYNSGWSAGAPPADCGSWVWRGQAYQWAPAPCRPCPPGYDGR